MGRYLLKRLSQAVLVVVSVMVVVFVVTRLIGDPVAVMLPFEATAENRAILEAQLGLDRPILVQLGHYIVDAVQLDLGDSLWQRRPAIDIVLERLPPTIVLVVAGFALGVLLGVVIGVVSSLRPGGWVDRAAVTLGLLGVSLPQFWIGLMFIVFFSVGLGWFPTSGSGGIEFLVLPAVVLALPIVGRIALVTRSSMIDEMNAQHVKDAVARGVSRTRIVLVHALKGAGIATLTIAGWELIGALAGGAVVVETVYAWPGIGFTAMQAIERHDIILVQAVVFVVAIMVVTINIIVDITYAMLDPRVKLDRAR
ncbi:MAG: ABC transporter permease [Actinomycetia bacterium]|nr:ABC transporter permease [Actinomycetes bacterium]